MGLSRLTTGHDIGRDISQHNAATRAHGIGANSAELMYQGTATQHDIITDMDVSTQGGIVSHDQMISQDAVMGDMHIRHQQVVATDPGFALILHRTPMDGATFANNVVVTNNQAGRFPLILLVLTLFSDTGELEYLVVFTNLGRALDHDMRVNHRSRANFHIVPDKGPRSDFNIFGNPC